MPHTSVEMELLACCLKAYINPDQNTGHRINNILKEEIDWENFLNCAYTNRVVQLVHQGLKTVPRDLIPETVTLSLTDYCNKKIAHNLLAINELKKLLTLFREQNIPVIIYKGLALALLYSNISFREWSDLDIIVRKEDTHAVKDILLSIGYTAHQIYQFDEQFPDKHSCPFVKHGGIIILDVHWSLYDSEEKFSFPLTSIWDQCQSKLLLGTQIPVLSPGDMILSVCAHHGIRNFWSEFKYICDIAMLIKAYQKTDWIPVIKKAKELKIKRALLTGIYLANQIFEIILPYEIQQAIYKDKLSIKAASLIRKKLFNKLNEENKNGCDLLIRIYFIESVYSKIILYKRYLRALCKINDNDRKLIYFPPYLHFLYYVIKPFRLISKYNRLVSQ